MIEEYVSFVDILFDFASMDWFGYGFTLMDAIRYFILISISLSVVFYFFGVRNDD